MMNEYLTHLNLDYDQNKLIDEIYENKLKAYDLRNRNSWDSVYGAEWVAEEVNIRHRKHTGILNEGEHILELKSKFDNILKTETRAVATLHRKNTPLPMHRDNMPCCINIVLEGNISPITFKEVGDIYYKCALINVSEYHMVKSEDEPRLLLKYCITDKSYNECKILLSEYL